MKKLNVLFVVMFASICINAQTVNSVMENHRDDFFEVIKEVELISDDVLTNSTEKEQKGYGRWKAFWETRVDVQGSMSTYINTWKNYYLNSSNKQATSTNEINLQWEQLGPFETSGTRNWQGRCQSVCVNPTDANIVYLGTMGSGVFKSTNALTTDPTQVQWTCKTPQFSGLGAFDIKLHPDNPNEVYFVGSVYSNGLIATRNYSVGLFKSTDAGENWTLEKESDVIDNLFFTAIAFDPVNSNIMYLLADKGIYRRDISVSADWSFIYLDDNAQFFDIVINPLNTNEIYLAGKNMVYKSTDGGVSYSNITLEIDPTTYKFYCVDYNMQDSCFYVLLGTDYWVSDYLKKYDGSQWIQVGTIPSNPYNASSYVADLKIAPNGDIYAGGVRIYFSNNGGNNFFGINYNSVSNPVHDDTRNIAFSNISSGSNGTPIFFATDGGICRSLTGGNSGWQSINGNQTFLQFMGFDVSESNPEIMGGGTSDNYSWVRDANGTWRHVLYSDGGPMAIDPVNPSIMIGTAGASGLAVRKTSDAFSTSPYWGTSTGITLPMFDSKVVKHPSATNTFFLCERNLLKTTDGGNTFNSIYNYTTWNERITAVDISKSNPNLVICSKHLYGGHLSNYVQSGNLAITQNGGSTWEEISSPNTIGIDADLNTTPVTDIEINPENENDIWISFGRFADGQKIYKSSNTGQSWQNISYNLPNIPVNALEYDKNNGILFIGTDFGLYYLLPNSNGWIKYTDIQFPEVIISSLNIVESSNELVIATAGRGVLRANLSCLSNAFQTQIANNVIWSTNTKLNKDIIIKNSGTLTINSNIEVSQDKKIIIEPGGKLILDGGKLTSNTTCSNTLWQGIEIQGNSSLDQTNDANQGVLELKNGAVIENAVIGVLLGHWKIDQYHPAYGGGILRVEPGCTFRNNTTAIKFTAYSQPNTSYIYGSQFITDANYLGTTPSPFISLTSVNGVNIKGNTFKNENYTAFAYNKRGQGISSSGSRFTVDDYTISGTTYQSKFENLWYGINANNYTSVNTFEIKNTDFKNNYIGVKLGAINYASIGNNNFEVNSQAPSNDNSCGVYILSSSGFGVQNNNFTTTNNGHYGVYVNNTGSTANTIYQNRFTGLQTNIQADNQNSKLVMRCNNFNSTSIADIAISGSISFKQGSCLSTTSAANNLFNRTGASTDIWTNPGTSVFNYAYNPSSRTTPQNINSNYVWLYQCGSAYDPFHMCLTRATRTSSELITDISSSSSILNQLRNQIDGGNTQDLLTIALSNQAPGQIKNQLLAVGPYLSDEVLLAAIQRSGTTPLPDGILKEIVEPNSPVSKDVLKAIINRNPAISGGTLNEINNEQTGTSPRTELEFQIAENTEQNGAAINELLQYYLLDTNIENGIDSLIAFLLTQDNLESTQQLIQAYIYTGQCTEAQTLLSQLQPETDEEINFVEFFNLLVDICINNDTIYNLNTQQLQTITDIANSGTAVSTNAQSLLSLINGEDFPETFTALIAPDTSKIYGYLYESADCGGNPVAGDTLQITDADNNAIQGLSAIITDNDGSFEINQYIFYLLDITQAYSFTTKSGYKIGAINGEEMPQYKTISEWINESPLTLNLSNENLEWTDFYTSPDSMATVGTAIDLGGNVYVAGRTRRFSSNDDIVLIKYTPQGERMWASIYNSGRADNDFTDDIALDKEGNCLIAVTSENANVVLLKYNTDGQLQWSKSINNTPSMNYGANSVKVNNTGDVYISGTRNNSSTLASDIFVAKYDKKGNQKWLKTFTINTYNGANAMSMDNAGNVIITGFSYSNTVPQNPNCITLKYNANGSLLWSKIYDSGNDDFGQKITTDQAGDIYVTGAGNNMFTIKYNTNGIQQWQSTEISLNPSGIVTDNNNNTYVVSNSGLDIYTIKYDANGVQQWEQIYNDSFNGFDYGYSIKTDLNNNIYITGRSATISSSSRTQTNDILLIKYSHEGEILWKETFRTPTNSVNCGNDLVVSENDNIYITGYSGGMHNPYLATLKYSQCPSTANLKSAVYKPDVTVNNQELQDIDDDELIQVINFKENKVIVYPNPYTESTRIELITKTDAQVSLDVYTMGGQKIADIFNGEAKEGKYNYTFSAKKLGYSAGTYVLMIKVNNEVNSYWLVEMK